MKRSYRIYLIKINGAKVKPALLKIIQPYAKQFNQLFYYQGSFSEYYNPEALHKDYLSLLEICESVYQTIKVS